MRLPGAWWVVPAVLVVALRAALLVASVPSDRALSGDEPVYDELARNVMGGHGYTWHGAPYVFKPPGWPLVLAAIYLTLGDSLRSGVIVQCLLDGASALLAGLIAWGVFRNRVVSALAFLVMLAWPPFLRESRSLQTEPLFTFCALLSVWVFQRFIREPRWWLAGLVGVTVGLATYVRPTAPVLLAGLLLGWVALARREAMRHAPKLVLAALGFALVMVPWAARNTMVFGRVIPVAAGGGEFFFLGAVIETDGRWDHRRWGAIRERVLAPEEARLGRRLDPVEADRVFMRAGFEIWRNDPWKSAEISLKRFGRLVFVAHGKEQAWLRWGFLASLLAVYGLALPAALAGFRHRDSPLGFASVMAVALVFTALVSSMMYTNSRYFEPFRPLALILAAGTVGSALGARSRRPSWLPRRPSLRRSRLLPATARPG